MNHFIDKFFIEVNKAIDNVSRDEISKALNILQSTYEKDGRIYIFGNGGSLALATHWVSDFNKTVFSYHLNAGFRRFQAIRLPTTESELTAWANDVGYETVFSGPLKNYLQESDAVIAISSSGNSDSVIKAVEFAKELNVPVIGLTGFDGGKLKPLADACIHVDTEKRNYEVVEGVHGVILHLIIKYFKDYFNYIFDQDAEVFAAKSPLRLEFLGGSTDLKNYYSLHEGRVLNSTIDKYVYVSVKQSSSDNYVISANGEVQTVDDIEKIDNMIIRESLKTSNIANPVEILIKSDIHQNGSGLGSSSALTAATLKALSLYKGRDISKRDLSEKACHVEIELTGAPIGKQDQYATSFGGLNLYKFKMDGYVDVEDLKLDTSFIQKLNEHILLFDTGNSHSSSKILAKQNSSFEKNLPYLKRMADLTLEGVEALKAKDIKSFAKVLYEEWSVKKKLSKGIVNKQIENLYKKAVKAGAWGGRVSGAGGGGFILLVVPPSKQSNVRKALKGYKEMEYKFSFEGTKETFLK